MNRDDRFAPVPAGVVASPCGSRHRIIEQAGRLRWRRDFMQCSISFPALAIALATSLLVAACGSGDPGGPTVSGSAPATAAPTATLSGVVRANGGGGIEG